MTYREKYYSIINSRKNNPLSDDVYGEFHHIKPRSVYPSLAKEPTNIVRLTAGEHYKCHYYLVKMYEEEGNREAYRKMLYAFNMMSRIFTSQKIPENEIEELSKLYDEIKVKFRDMRLGHEVSEETRRKISEKGRGRKRPKEVCLNMSRAKRGKSPSKKHRESLSKAGTSYWANQSEHDKRLDQFQSEEYKKKVSDGVKKWLEEHPEIKKKRSEIATGHPGYTTGMHWFNNGVETILAPECPEGYWKGRIYRRKK